MGTLVEIVKIVKINEDKQNACLRIFLRLPTTEKIEVMADHRKLVHKLKQIHAEIGVPMLSYCALIMAVQVYKTNQDNLKRLNISNLSLDEIRDITSKKAKVFLHKQFRKQSKRECLLNYWSVVRSLKIDEHVSFRKIEVYLKKYHKIDVSYSLIAKTWTEIERKDEKNG